MSRKVTFKLNAEEAEAALQFSNQINLPLDFIAKQSLFMSIQQAYARAAKGVAGGNTTEGNLASNPTDAAPGGLPGGGAALADKGGVASDGVG